jgi:outer membrane receptor protein involved in Fe transport
MTRSDFDGCHRSATALPAHSRFAALLMLGAALCLFILLTAQFDLAFADSDSQPEFVTVSATRGASAQDLDVSTTVLDSDQVQSAPEPSIDQIVNKIPGIYTPAEPGNELHPTGQPFSIRGFGTSTNINTLLMIDGIPANDAYFRTVDWAQVPKDSIESIEVIRGGGASSLWGDMAMGGVVNVVTKPPSSGGMVDLSAGGFDGFNAQGSAGLNLTDTLSVGFDMGVSKSGGYNLTPANYRNPNMSPTDSGTQNYQLSAVFAPSNDTMLYLKLFHHRITEDGLVWSNARNIWQTDRIAAGGTTGLLDFGNLNFSAWYGQGQMFTQNVSNATYTIFSPGTAAPYVSQTERVSYHHMGGSLFFSANWGDIKDINIGVDARSIWANDPLNLFSATGPTGDLLADAKHQFQGIFAQGSWHVEQIPLQVTLGLRQDLWQAQNGSILGTYKGSGFSGAIPNQSYSRFDPRLGLKYDLPFGIDLRAALYDNFAAPGMNQMYRSFISGSNYTTFNATLKPQTNFGREVGADLAGDNYHVSFTLYDNSLKNFIDYATVQSGCAADNNYCGTAIAGIAGGSLRQYVNAGDATLKGGELIGDWAVFDTVSLRGGVTMTDAYLTRSNYATPSAGVIPDPIRQQLGQIPRWMLTGGADWQATPGLQLNLTMRSFPGYWANTSHTQFDSAATVFDLGASYRLWAGSELYLMAQNILNHKYLDQGLGYTSTNGTTVLDTTIPALGLPFNMSGGLRVSF